MHLTFETEWETDLQSVKKKLDRKSDKYRNLFK